MTLNDRERPLFCVISPNSVTSGAYYVKVVEDTPKHSEMYSPKNLVFSGISLMAIFVGNRPQRKR